MNTRVRKTAIGIAGLCFGAVLSAASAMGAEKAPAPEKSVEKLPPCEVDKPIPKGGCMAPADPVTPLDSLRPAPPLNVPPSGSPPINPIPPLGKTPVPIPPPGKPPLTPPSADSPAIVKPPPTGDSEIIKPPPQADSKMPVIKPPANPEPRTKKN